MVRSVVASVLYYIYYSNQTRVSILEEARQEDGNGRGGGFSKKRINCK